MWILNNYEKIHLTQLLYWHNMTLLEQTDILGRRPVCACVCLSVSVSYEGMSMEGFLPIVGGEGCWRWQYLILADRFAQMASATAAPNATNRVTRVRAISHVTPKTLGGLLYLSTLFKRVFLESPYMECWDTYLTFAHHITKTSPPHITFRSVSTT